VTELTRSTHLMPTTARLSILMLQVVLVVRGRVAGRRTCRLLGPRLQPSGAIVSSKCPVYMTARRCTFSPSSSRRCLRSGGAEKRTAGSRRHGGRQQQVGVSVNGEDAGFIRSGRCSSSRRSSGDLQNTQKEVRLLRLLQPVRKNRLPVTYVATESQPPWQ
jgi:hypothetical protein